MVLDNCSYIHIFVLFFITGSRKLWLYSMPALARFKLVSEHGCAKWLAMKLWFPLRRLALVTQMWLFRLNWMDIKFGWSNSRYWLLFKKIYIYRDLHKKKGIEKGDSYATTYNRARSTPCSLFSFQLVFVCRLSPNCTVGWYRRHTSLPTLFSSLW